MVQMDEIEKKKEEMGLTSKANPVFFISLVGVNEEGLVDDNEYIFDIYTKTYDFLGCSVQTLSAQDLWSFYERNHPGANKKKVKIYTVGKYFVQKNPDGHYFFDECPLLDNGKMRFITT